MDTMLRFVSHSPCCSPILAYCKRNYPAENDVEEHTLIRACDFNTDSPARNRMNM